MLKLKVIVIVICFWIIDYRCMIMLKVDELLFFRIMLVSKINCLLKLVVIELDLFIVVVAEG
jgi:hypothetical protein